jgi:ABC-type antimicrobial peptide transport system permease subunit
MRYVATAVGGLVGLGAGFGFYAATGFIMNQGGLFAGFHVRTDTVLLGLAIAATVGIASATFPALRASRTSIAEALRYVG